MKKWSGGLALACLVFPAMAGAGELAVGGAAVVYDGAIRGMDEQSAALPFVHYEGERFSVVFTSVTWHLVRSESFRLGLVGSGRFDGYESSDSAWLAGMRTRDPAFDMGLEAGYGNLSLSVVTDVTGRHKGTEASLRYAHSVDLGKLQLQFTPGVRWQDEKLTGYYFGVREDERATLQIDGSPWVREAYRPGHALIPEFSMLALYRVSPRWSAVTGAQASYLPRAISDSPIVARDVQWGLFTGLAYHFR